MRSTRVCRITRDPVMTSHTARSNPGSTGRAPPSPGTIRQRLRGEGNDHHHRAARGQQEAGARLHRPGVQPAQPGSKAADFVTGGVVWHGNSLGDNGRRGESGRPARVCSYRGAAGPARGRAGHYRRERPGHGLACRGPPRSRAACSACRPTASRSGGTPWTSTGSPTARSARNGRPTTSRPSWPSSVSSARRGPPDIPRQQPARPARERTPT